MKSLSCAWLASLSLFLSTTCHQGSLMHSWPVLNYPGWSVPSTKKSFWWCVSQHPNMCQTLQQSCTPFWSAFPLLSELISKEKQKPVPILQKFFLYHFFSSYCLRRCTSQKYCCNITSICCISVSLFYSLREYRRIFKTVFYLAPFELIKQNLESDKISGGPQILENLFWGEMAP